PRSAPLSVEVDKFAGIEERQREVGEGGQPAWIGVAQFSGAPGKPLGGFPRFERGDSLREKFAGPSPFVLGRIASQRAAVDRGDLAGVRLTFNEREGSKPSRRFQRILRVEQQ